MYVSWKRTNLSVPGPSQPLTGTSDCHRLGYIAAIPISIITAIYTVTTGHNISLVSRVVSKVKLTTVSHPKQRISLGFVLISILRYVHIMALSSDGHSPSQMLLWWSALLLLISWKPNNDIHFKQQGYSQVHVYHNHIHTNHDHGFPLLPLSWFSLLNVRDAQCLLPYIILIKTSLYKSLETAQILTTFMDILFSYYHEFTL